MRLLQAHSRTLICFDDTQPIRGKYAILSHVWDLDEVRFEDIQSSRSLEHKRGYVKMRYACQQAMIHGLEYVWIDSCCIDKRSSAELSEAINSMYSWYREAACCYAYLADVGNPVRQRGTSVQSNRIATYQALRDSRWFKRGWTLQELIAPAKVHFYGQDWTFLGTKASLCAELEEITAIPKYVLQDAFHLKHVSVVQKMKWAAYRQTTRKEDEAYCLLGLRIRLPVVELNAVKHIVLNCRYEDDFTGLIALPLEFSAAIPESNMTGLASLGINDDFDAPRSAFQICYQVDNECSDYLNLIDGGPAEQWNAVTLVHMSPVAVEKTQPYFGCVIWRYRSPGNDQPAYITIAFAEVKHEGHSPNLVFRAFVDEEPSDITGSYDLHLPDWVKVDMGPSLGPKVLWAAQLQDGSHVDRC
ncbi:Putative heterokaryon incompatibility [Septoria linicola]|uniref:Heterokaryon incompatibility n=1 Tax=Septoria linicola TaxID=215465 RepID=A0A9Q9AMH5_9PEZI|nr:Putative heterokaryon incompatibility [Septoria linicola]